MATGGSGSLLQCESAGCARCRPWWKWQSWRPKEAKLANPEAITVREASRTKFSGLNTEQAAKVDAEAFPRVIEEPVGGPPELSGGESITGYLSDSAAQVDFGEGQHGVIESLEPLAVETSPGHREPVDLSLDEVGGVFQPVRSVVALRIPKQLVDGVQLRSTGVSLTPVDASGSPLGGSEGVVDGATVLYANTQTDADTIVKPLALGFEEDTLLRSVESPDRLYFRVGLPEGASVVQASGASGAVKVVQDGQTIGVIRAPSAVDAAGTQVPTQMTVSGGMLALSVEDSSGGYQFPIMVDPEVVDEHFTAEETHNWRFVSEGLGFDGDVLEEGWTYYLNDDFNASAWGSVEYPTQGKSHITKFQSETSATDPSKIENRVGIINSSKTWEGVEPLPSSYGTKPVTVNATGSANEDLAEVYSNATLAETEGKGSGVNHFYHGAVTISQTEGPSVSFNTTSSTTRYGQPNVLHTGGWMNAHWGEVEINASDPGLGISRWGFGVPGSLGELNRIEGGACAGVQCPESFGEGIGYSRPNLEGKVLPNGEDTVEAKVWDAAGLSATAVAPVKVKVDTTPPYALALLGLPASGVIDEEQYHLKGEATDGKAPTPSSGIKSIDLFLDEREIAGKSGSCPLGQCTADGEWTLNVEGFGAGKHTLTLQAADNAGNVETKTYSIIVRHASAPWVLGRVQWIRSRALFI